MKCPTRSGIAGTTTWLLFSKHFAQKKTKETKKELVKPADSLFSSLASVRRLWRLCLAGLVVAATLAFWAAPARALVVLDGGFEAVGGVTNNGYSLFTGSLGDGWTVTSGEILVERGTVNGIPHSGNQYAYLDGDFALNTLSQTLPTSPGQQYTISFWIADSDPNLFQATFAGQTLYNGPAPASGGGFPATHYVNEVFNVTATSTASALTLSGQWTSGTGTVLDDVSIVAVPEPAAVILFAGAILAAAVVRDRRVR
jgi:hypothetical protein